MSGRESPSSMQGWAQHNYHQPDHAEMEVPPEVLIVPKEWNQADAFNYGKVPSGILISTAGGQTVEMWQGVHVPQSWAVSNGVPSE